MAAVSYFPQSNYSCVQGLYRFCNRSYGRLYQFTFGEKPIRERRNIGSGYGEIAYLGDAYQMSIDRLSELQDLIDKFNAAKPADQRLQWKRL